MPAAPAVPAAGKLAAASAVPVLEADGGYWYWCACGECVPRVRVNGPSVACQACLALHGADESALGENESFIGAGECAIGESAIGDNQSTDA